jgi:small subunit ribosomal protein S20
MALRIKSAIKKNRQSQKRNDRNTKVRSALRTSIKNLLVSISEKDLNKSNELLKAAIKSLDKAATKDVIHRKTASRNVSKLSKKVHQLSLTSQS